MDRFLHVSPACVLDHCHLLLPLISPWTPILMTLDHPWPFKGRLRVLSRNQETRPKTQIHELWFSGSLQNCARKRTHAAQEKGARSKTFQNDATTWQMRRVPRVLFNCERRRGGLIAKIHVTNAVLKSHQGGKSHNIPISQRRYRKATSGSGKSHQGRRNTMAQAVSKRTPNWPKPNPKYTLK
jgi:hypothetical protein